MFSFINHSKNENIVRKFPQARDDIIMVYALKNIKKGEELAHDYAKDIKGQKRIAALSNWGISEWDGQARLIDLEQRHVELYWESII